MLRAALARAALFGLGLLAASCTHPDYGDTPSAAVSIAKAEAELGFCPRTDLRQGLLALLSYYRQQDAAAHRSLTEGATGNPHFSGRSRPPPAKTPATDDPTDTGD